MSFDGNEEKKKESAWNRDELEAAVDAYLWMLQKEQQGVAYSKTAVRQEYLTRQLQKRSSAAFEYRMRNISAVLQKNNSAIIKGYQPAKNVGSKAAEDIEGLLLQKINMRLTDKESTGDGELLGRRVSNLRRRTQVDRPRKKNLPAQSVMITQARYIRDPTVKAWVLQSSNGICEGCNSNAPFTGEDGLPFLEVHHVRQLAENGSDRVENAVALCPNCHRRCHFSADKEEFKEGLYAKIKRLIPE